MGSTLESMDEPGDTSAQPAGEVRAMRHHSPRSLGRTVGHGLVHGLASATGGAIVTGLIWWSRR